MVPNGTTIQLVLAGIGTTIGTAIANSGGGDGLFGSAATPLTVAGIAGFLIIWLVRGLFPAMQEQLKTAMAESQARADQQENRHREERTAQRAEFAGALQSLSAMLERIQASNEKQTQLISAAFSTGMTAFAGAVSSATAKGTKVEAEVILHQDGK